MVGRRPNAELRSREHLTADEVEGLIAAAKEGRHGHRDATMLLVAYRHGLRVSELTDFRWDQVDFATANLHIRRSPTRFKDSRCCLSAWPARVRVHARRHH
jgi:type 1 fimbriae regulatory protein FimB/type 1 fimbriae regulatory protein FimE